MKKILAMFLCVVMAFTTMVPTVSAAGISRVDELNAKIADSFEMKDDAGNLLKFVLIQESGERYTLNYYCNGVLTKTYEMGSSREDVTATNKAGKTYKLQPSKTIDSATLSETRGADRWGHAGYIQYGYSADFDCEPLAIVSYKDTDSDVGTYYVDTYQNSSFSDQVAIVTSILISAFTGVKVNSTIASGIVTGLIGLFGGEVINDTISVAFREEYTCSSVTYTMRAEVIGAGMTNNMVVDYEGGVENWVKYADAPDEHYDVGWTPRTWACRDFAIEVWNDSVPGNPTRPSIVGYPKYI